MRFSARRGASTRCILFVTHGCCLDDSNGAAVARRALVEALGRRGCAVEALSGIMLDLDRDLDPGRRLAGRGSPDGRGGRPWVEAVLRLWDDAAVCDEHRRQALAEARRWNPDRLEPRAVRFLEAIRPGLGAAS